MITFYYSILEIIWNVTDVNLRIENCMTMSLKMELDLLC